MKIIEKIEKMIFELNQISENLKSKKPYDEATNVNSKTIRPMSRLKTGSQKTESDPIKNHIINAIEDIIRG